jgi:hypothetical protein
MLIPLLRDKHATGGPHMRSAARRLTTLLGVLLLVFAFTGATATKAHAVACVFWVRQLTDMALRGDAWNWWDAAAGRYERGANPEVGSVLVFKRARGLSRGHVSTVSRVIDRRTVEVDHSWLSDNRLYRGMRVVDISPRNDWSSVRVWHPRIDDLGSTVYPTYGFVLPDRPRPDLLFASIRETAPSAGERRSVAPEVTETGDRSGRRPVGPATRPGRPAETAIASAGDVRPSLRGTIAPQQPRRGADGAAQVVQASLPAPGAVPTRKPVAMAEAAIAMPAPAAAVIPARNPVRLAEAAAAAIRNEIGMAEHTARVLAAAVDTGRLDFAWATDAHDERDRID